MTWNPDLRDDCEVSNGERAEVAWSCLVHGKYQPESEAADAVSDLFADLLHLCNREGYDVLEIWARATMHYEHESNPAHHMPLPDPMQFEKRDVQRRGRR